MSRPKAEIHYLFGPNALLIESKPEFGAPSITSCFVYVSFRPVSEGLADLELRSANDPNVVQVKRFKLLTDGKTKTLEMATDAAEDPEPTVQILEFVDGNWSGTSRQ